MANVNIRVEDDVKKDVEYILKELGLNLSTATNMFYKQILTHHGIPFEIKMDPFYSKKNIAYLEKAYNEMKNGKGGTHDIIEDLSND